MNYFGASLDEVQKNNAANQMNGLLDTLKDAKEYGSILNVENYDWNLLRAFVKATGCEGQMSVDSMGAEQSKKLLERLVDIGETLAGKYDVVVTNPPYMGSSGMGNKLTVYVKNNYPNSKTDLFAIFIERCSAMSKMGYIAMITQHAWMFLSSFEKLRQSLNAYRIVNMSHLGARAFDEISGEVVQTTSFVFGKSTQSHYNSTFIRLTNLVGEKNKLKGFFDEKNRFYNDVDKLKAIPNKVIAYWVSDDMLSIFVKKKIKDYGNACIGMRTGDNARFLRLWAEVDFTKIGLALPSADAAMQSHKKWFPYCKGGTYRKWYGNNDYVVNWENDGYEIKENTKLVYPQLGDDLGWKISNESCYFRRGITWSGVGASVFGVRCYPEGMIFDSGANSFFVNENQMYEYFAGLLNTTFMNEIIKIINPTINTGSGVISVLPVIYDKDRKEDVKKIVNVNICLSKLDWDSFETSWDFECHPLLTVITKNRMFAYDVIGVDLAECFACWVDVCDERFRKLKENEEELNRIFINIYGLQNELTPEVEDKYITVRKADLGRDIRSLISYAVGCMFGRYSLDEPGLIYAGGEFDAGKYKTFPVDKDAIIPITEEAFFEDDIVSQFEKFIKTVYGEKTLEKNLDFIADALGTKGSSSREKIRNYFLNDFFKDHCNTYSVTGSGKRPIYWLFDSGKQNGFKCLIYLHRYTPDTVGLIRSDYLTKTQSMIENALRNAEYAINTTSSAVDRAQATKKRDKYIKQLAEIRAYYPALSHIALQRIALDLDDGVKVNYAKFQGIEVGSEGEKKQKIDLLAKI